MTPPTPDDRGPANETPTVETSEARPPTGEKQQFRMLLVVTTPETSTAYEFAARSVLTIGRCAPADILLNDPRLSRLHACFRCDGEVVRVRDLGSRNGTWVAGERVDEATLSVGGTAVLGGVSVSVQVATSTEAAMLGLLSSAAMLQRIEEECLRSRLFQRPLSILIVRPLRSGDLSASLLGSRCRAALRPLDRAGLYDRDALLALLPETSTETAATIAERMIAPLRGEAELVCGLSTAPEAGFSSEQLVSAAWSALRSTSNSQRLVIAPRVPHVRSAPAEAAIRCNPETLALQRTVERVGPHRISVLLLGETGTGKELIARELHEHGARSEAPLRVLNCAAIPDNLIESVLFGHVKGAFVGAERDQTGVFVQANGGTIFLDEVAELSAEAQAALLRVLDVQRVTPIGSCDEIQVEVRVIAATHRDLAAMTEQGSFRLDLYHRLNGVVLRIPPLRDRRDEIAALVEHFLDYAGMPVARGAPRISVAALNQLRAYNWPGNVRELRNVIERAVALCDGVHIDSCDLPAHIAMANHDPSAGLGLQAELQPSPVASHDDIDLRATLQEHEARLIEEALRRSRGNQRRAASFLRLPLRTFERKLKMLGDRLTKTP